MDDDLDLEAVFAYLKRWSQARAWGEVTIVFRDGVPVLIKPQPTIKDRSDLRRRLPQLPPSGT